MFTVTFQFKDNMTTPFLSTLVNVCMYNSTDHSVLCVVGWQQQLKMECQYTSVLYVYCDIPI